MPEKWLARRLQVQIHISFTHALPICEKAPHEKRFLKSLTFRKKRYWTKFNNFFSIFCRIPIQNRPRGWIGYVGVWEPQSGRRKIEDRIRKIVAELPSIERQTEIAGEIAKILGPNRDNGRPTRLRSGRELAVLRSRWGKPGKRLENRSWKSVLFS